MQYNKLRLAAYSTIDLPIRGILPTSPFIVKNVDGLGPPEIAVSIATTNNDGIGFYQGRKTQDREIVVSIGLNPDYSSGQTASDLRTLLYGLLVRSQEDFSGYHVREDGVTISIMNDSDVLMSTLGFVAKMEINPFSKDPEVAVTLNCPKSFFETDLHHETGIVYTPITGAVTIPNIGTVPTGFYFETTFTTTQSIFDMLNSNGSMIITYPFAVGDRLYFNTQAGEREIMLDLAAIGLNDVNMLPYIDPSFKWLQLDVGDNYFDGATQLGHATIGDVNYVPKFWGV